MRQIIFYSLALCLTWVSFALADVTLSVPEQVLGRPGGSVTVPISIDDATGVAGGSVTLTFKGDVVGANEIQQTNLIAGFSFVSNIVGNEARFAFANATGLPSGSGAIATVSLTVNPEAKDGNDSALILSEVVLFGENAQVIPTTVSNGKLTVDTTLPTIEMSVSPSIVKNGQSFTLTVKTGSGLMVMADLSDLDTVQTEPVSLQETATAGMYTAVIPISEANMATDGVKTIAIDVMTAGGILVGTETGAIELRTFSEIVLTIPQGISLIHIPLTVTAVNDKPAAIKAVSDLYDVLGADRVNFIITRDTLTGVWRSYLGQESKGTSADLRIADDMGLIPVMKQSVTLHLEGTALGTDGISQIQLNPGTNLIGVPLKDERLQRVSDFFNLEGVKDQITAIIVSNQGQFKIVARPGDNGDIPITGEQSFIITARAAGVAEIRGEAWDNVSGGALSASPMAVHFVDGSAPILAVHGAVIDKATGLARERCQVTVKNLSTGASLNNLSGGDNPEGGYSVTFVDPRLSRAAQIGDTLEITAKAPSPLIGVQPLHYIISASDAKEGLIHLPDLVAYEIPTKTQLLPNFPNPFNPETWIPYRLARDAFVTLTIYDTKGTVVRTLNVGHQPAAFYESKQKAIYWDGRNNSGERVASGVYFYTLTANDFAATRKLLILK